MARSSTADDLSCPICFEFFIDPNTPKNLPCGHVCCEICLDKMATEKTAKACPECRMEISIPKRGVSSLPTNFRLRNLSERHQQSPKRTSTDSGVPICPDHDEEKMHYYCRPCNMLACRACLILKHASEEHEITDVLTMYAKQRAVIEAAAERINRSVQAGEHMLQELDEFKTKVCNSHVGVTKQIDKCFELCVQRLHQQKDELKEELCRAKESKLAEIDQKLRKVRQEVESSRESHRSTMDALESSSEYEFVTQHALLSEQLENSEVKEHKIPLGLTPHAAATFIPNRGIISIGSIKPVIPGRPREVTLIQTLGGFKGATHVTTSPTGLLAVCDFDDKKVTVYHKVKGVYEERMKLKLNPSDGHAPVSVAIHPDGRFLVARQSCVEVFSPEGNYLSKIETSSRVADGTPMNVFSVASTNDGQILMGDIGRSVITEHDASGELVRTIQTNVNPVYMSIVHDCHIAMSDWKTGKVCVMDMETEQETLRIDIQKAKGICYDDETESLIVAKSKSGILEQYGFTSGKLAAYIACIEQGLHTPCGMTMADEGHLVVANYKSVNIYKLE